MADNKKEGGNGSDRESLPYPDSGWLPGLQRTIKRKLENGEIDEVNGDIFHGMMGQISREKGDEK